MCVCVCPLSDDVTLDSISVDLISNFETGILYLFIHV